MPSFEVYYDEDGDVLEASFDMVDDEHPRTIELNDNIVLFADKSLEQAGGLAFYSYAKLLQVNETDMDGLRALPEFEARKALSLLCSSPVSAFLEVLDPAELRARVVVPDLRALLPRA